MNHTKTAKFTTHTGTIGVYSYINLLSCVVFFFQFFFFFLFLTEKIDSDCLCGSCVGWFCGTYYAYLWSCDSVQNVVKVIELLA